MRTEKVGRTIGIGANALASSVVLVCRALPVNTVEITRRDFVNMTVAAGLAAAAGSDLAGQQHVVETNVEIKTPDGTCDAAFIHPASGAHPAVIIWPDAFGLRPSMRGLARRLAADGGYSVLVPNPFYRVAKAPVCVNGS